MTYTPPIYTDAQGVERCHCGSRMNGSDHCPECGCEEYESRCDHQVTPDNVQFDSSI